MTDELFEKLRAELGTSRRVADLERDLAVVKSKIETIDEAMASIRDLPMKVAELYHSMLRCEADTTFLRAQIEARATERKKEQEEREQEKETARKEKKSDRRWMIGTMLTTGALIVASLGLLLDKF